MTSLKELQEIARSFRFRVTRDTRGYHIRTRSYDYFLQSSRLVKKKLYDLDCVGNY